MLEQYRGFLFVSLGIITFLLYSLWSAELSEKQQEFERRNAQVPSTPQVSDLNTESNELTPPEGAPNSLPQNTESHVSSPSDVGRFATITTDKVKFDIDLLGGEVVNWELLDYQVTTRPDDEEKISLMTNKFNRTFHAVSGIISMSDSMNTPDKRNNNRARYRLVSDQLTLVDGAEALTIDLEWISPDGVIYTKRFTIARGEYLLDVEFIINNASSKPLEGLSLFTQFRRDKLLPLGQGSSQLGMQSYTGPAYSTQEEKYETYDFGEIEEERLDVTTKGGWIAFLQHYFVSAWVPPQDSYNRLYTEARAELNTITISSLSSQFNVAAGETQSIRAQLYAGPKHQEVLKSIAPYLELTINYGFLFFIGEPIFQLLQFFYEGAPSWGIPGFGNWGVAIILVTLFIKLLLYPLASSQYRSFAKMRKLQPKLLQLKDRYGNDRQKMSQAMMELYRKEKVNPLGGCLPMLMMMPIFLALYWVLFESVEIRHAPFMFWIQDLSAKDPYFVLPILMGASMYLMQKMQPTPPTQDPMQVKVMQLLPVMMTALFLFFPAGLVLYWLVNNVLSILQQVVVTRAFDKAQAAK
ncbi:MAG: membrane protein insertase YidC [Pseudomonadota bacterium]